MQTAVNPRKTFRGREIQIKIEIERGTKIEEVPGSLMAIKKIDDFLDSNFRRICRRKRPHKIFKRFLTSNSTSHKHRLERK